MNAKLLRAIQHRNARAAISSSSMRGAGSKGVVLAARAYLCDLDLAAFGTNRAQWFADVLDQATEELRTRLPKKAQRWGLARKGLNIFLRDCLYTGYFREAYRLDRAEEFFEVPLDSICSLRLFRASGKILPKWPGVRALDPQTSGLYQALAASSARDAGFARVHWDAIWWGARDGDVEVKLKVRGL